MTQPTDPTAAPAPASPVPEPGFKQWPSLWMRDEKFWREVASRTLAGVFSVFILGALGALVVFGIRPDTRAEIGAGLLFAGTALFIQWIVYLIALHLLFKRLMPNRKSGWAPFVFTLYILLLTVATVLAFTYAADVFFAFRDFLRDRMH